MITILDFTYKQIILKSLKVVDYDLKSATKKSAGAQRSAVLTLLCAFIF